MARQHAAQLGGAPPQQQAAAPQAGGSWSTRVSLTLVAGLTPQQLAEFKALLDGLTRSKDSIRAGKEWVLAHAHAADAVTAELRSRTAHPMASFDGRLNLVYLVSDVLFNCIKQDVQHKELMSAALARDLVPTFSLLICRQVSSHHAVVPPRCSFCARRTSHSRQRTNRRS